MEGHNDTATDDVAAALADLGALLSEHASACSLEHLLLTAENPSFPAG